jgi:hypothetical protein
MALSCTASMSNPTPKVGMQTHVMVQTASQAKVDVVARSKMATASRTITADADGHADVVVAVAAPESPVTVEVTVDKSGRTASCATVFTPVALPTPTATPGLPPIQVTTQPIPPANASTADANA